MGTILIEGDYLVTALSVDALGSLFLVGADSFAVLKYDMPEHNWTLRSSACGDARSRRALALAVTFHVSRCRKEALNVLALQIWLFMFPPSLDTVKTCLKRSV